VALGFAGETAATLPFSGVRWEPWLRRALFYLALLAVWQIIAASGLWPPYVVPSPQAVAASLADGLSGGVSPLAAAISLSRLAVGYAISVGLGVVLGIVIARSRLADELLGSLVLALQSLPSVCWLPLAILWFGLNQTAVIFVVVMGALFSITLGVAAGVRNTPPLYVKAARNMGSRGWRLESRVIIPAARIHGRSRRHSRTFKSSLENQESGRAATQRRSGKDGQKKQRKKPED